MTFPQTPLGRARQLVERVDRSQRLPPLSRSLSAHFVHAPDFVKCFIKGLQNRRQRRRADRTDGQTDQRYGGEGFVRASVRRD